jgi:hypothetical protein
MDMCMCMWVLCMGKCRAGWVMRVESQVEIVQACVKGWAARAVKARTVCAVRGRAHLCSISPGWRGQGRCSPGWRGQGRCSPGWRGQGRHDLLDQY